MLRSLRGLRLLDWLSAWSSSIGEDGGAAGFAGQHLARLAVPPDRLAPAMADVARRATTQSAASCRFRLDLGPPTPMAVIIRTMIPADVAGVMFTRDPRTGSPTD